MVSAFPLAAILACSPPAARDLDRPDVPERAAEPPGAPEAAVPPEERPARRDAPPRASDAAPELPKAHATLLQEHNRYRARHCAPPLSWSPELEDSARRWARELERRGCPLEHSRLPYGENLAAATAGSLDPQGVVDLWYEEVDDYDFAAPGFAMQTGHFTQLVWAASRALGCASASCPGVDLWICHYTPPGNSLDRFAANVLPTTCER